MQKAQAEISPLISKPPVNGTETDLSTVIHEDGTVSRSNTLADAGADDDASTRAVLSLDGPGGPRSASSATNIADGIPVIRISAESDRGEDPSRTSHEQGVNGNVKQNWVESAGDTLEKPVQAAAGEGGEGTQDMPSPNAAQEPFSFSNKRLCERWLDNLFMVLYEVMCAVLRCYRRLTPDYRIYGCGLSSEPRLPTLKRSMLHIVKPVLNGRFSETWVFAYIIKKRRRRLISDASTPRDTPKSLGRS
jgi:hypothetical protein